ncbi:unnamed protein product, partial [Rotaria sp. Silwood2]
RKMLQQQLDGMELCQDIDMIDNDDDQYYSDVSEIDAEIIDSAPFPDECQNVITGIESFYRCFTRRYEACPVFFMGSLQDACREAFTSTVIKEVRSHLLL